MPKQVTKTGFAFHFLSEIVSLFIKMFTGILYFELNAFQCMFLPRFYN